MTPMPGRLDGDPYDDPNDKPDDEVESCPDCHGEGYVLADCFEDSCCCANPEEDHDLVPCATCGGAA
jgi:hypothetical protein